MTIITAGTSARTWARDPASCRHCGVSLATPPTATEGFCAECDVRTGTEHPDAPANRTPHITRVDLWAQRNKKGQLYGPSERVGVECYVVKARLPTPLPVAACAHARPVAVVVADETERARARPGSMTLVYSRTTGRVLHQMFHTPSGLLGTLAYSPRGRLLGGERPEVFIECPSEVEGLAVEVRQDLGERNDGYRVLIGRSDRELGACAVYVQRRGSDRPGVEVWSADDWRRWQRGAVCFDIDGGGQR